MLKLLLLFAWHLVLTGLPLAAVTLFAVRKGIDNVPLLLATAVAASGVFAMLAFWLYFVDRFVGQIFSYSVVLGSVAVLAWSASSGRLDSAILRQLATPLALWVLGSSFLIFLGYVHGGVNSPLATAATRFTGFTLPSDNDIPRYFTDWFYGHGHSGRPPPYPPDWLFSDRPPLQVGYVLLQRPFGWDKSGLNYQLVAVLLQQLWIVALWALLLAARVRPTTAALSVITVLVSDLAIVNGFFVWPKMLPAAMLVAAGALILTPLWSQVRKQPAAIVLIAMLLALAMLGHGSSIFAVVPLAILAVIRGLPEWRSLVVGVAVAVLLLAPWSIYQKYGDAPGNRLTKEALAGVLTVNHYGTLRAVLHAYGAAGLDGTLHNKAENFVYIAGGGPMVNAVESSLDSFESGNLGNALRLIRTVLFFYFIPSFGLLAIAPLLIAVGRLLRPRHGADWTFGMIAYGFVGIGVVAWALVMFGAGAGIAVVHQGSYALPLLGFCAGVAGLRAVLPRFAIYFVVVSDLLMLAAYVPSPNPPPSTTYSVAAALIALSSLVAFSTIAFALDRSALPGRFFLSSDAKGRARGPGEL